MVQGKGFNVRDHCEKVFSDLTLMKSKLQSHVRELEQVGGAEKIIVGTHIAHLRDIIRTIDWKLEILMRACPYEWTGYTYDLQYCASVPVQDEKELIESGYVGG